MGGSSAEDSLRRWAESGAMALCGPADGPPSGPPAPLIPVLDDVARRIGEASEAMGSAVELDPLRTLTERAAIAGFRRRGSTSCGGATRLLRARDGWLALTLARPDDVGLLPAWLGVEEVTDADADAAWPVVAAAVRDHPLAHLVADGSLLGLPAAAMGSFSPADGPPVISERFGDAPARPLSDVEVVDLSALWAGPLCGRILADAGAHVVKVESTSRPDGARLGPAAFFDLMNGGKRSVALDLAAPEGRRALVKLLERADVVIEASRPRALEAMGIDARGMVGRGPQVWMSITAYGRSEPGRARVGFGDDTAAAGGAIVRSGDEPCFCGDALADPVTGMVAAAAVLEALRSGGRWLLDVALARSAAAVAGPAVDASGVAALDPRPPAAPRRAAPLGADNTALLGDLAG